MRYKKPSNKAPEKMPEKKQICVEDTRAGRRAERMRVRAKKAVLRRVAPRLQ